MHAHALLSCRASGRPPSGGGAAAPLQYLPWTRRKGRGPVGPESHAFPDRTTVSYSQESNSQESNSLRSSRLPHAGQFSTCSA